MTNTTSETTVAQHTPGPWSAIRQDAIVADGDTEYDAFTIRSRSPEAFNQWALMGDYQGTEIAKVRRNPAAWRESEGARATIEANARLIAAAPDLLIENARLKARVASLEAEVVPNLCAYCTWEEPAPSTAGALQAHVAVCEYHPLRAVEAQRDELLAALKALATPINEAYPRSHAAMEAALAAIAKAEGRT